MDFDALFANLFAGIKACRICGDKHAELRPWPPDHPHAERLCGACRLKKALEMAK